jgi:hypothetical protein
VLPTYSFNDVTATLIGPGGTLILGAGSANAEEGITIEFLDDTDVMQRGADGNVVHSLIVSRAARAVLRYLKTSPMNSALNSMYNFQRSSSLYHGKNNLSIANPVTGDSYSGLQVAFAKGPSNSWGKEAALIEWDFNIGILNAVIGSLSQI